MAELDGPPPDTNDTERYLRGEFLGALAHAIRSPMGVVQGAIDELRETQDPADLQWLLPMLDRGVTRLLRLARNLSLVRDIETDRLNATLAQYDLVTIARQAASLDLHEAERIALELPTTPVHAQCDDSMVRLALEQLIDNALLHGRHEVHISARRDPWPCIEVWDDGPGLAVQDLDRLAARFVDARSRGAAGDLALGLSIARDAARLSGASLQIATGEHERGTVCRLRFDPPDEGREAEVSR